MSKPKVRAQADLPPMIDPDNVQEVYSNDVVIQVRQGGVQIIFNSIQGDRRVVRARVGLPGPVCNSMLQCFNELGVAIKQHEALAAAEMPERAN